MGEMPQPRPHGRPGCHNLQATATRPWALPASHRIAAIADLGVVAVAVAEPVSLPCRVIVAGTCRYDCLPTEWSGHKLAVRRGTVTGEIAASPVTGPHAAGRT